MKRIKLFGEFHPDTVARYGRVFIYLALVAILVVLTLNNLQNYIWIISASIVLLTENALKIWGFKSYQPKIACYVIDVLVLLILTFFSDGALISTLYVIILSEFYLNQKKLSVSLAMFICNLVLFLVIFAVSGALHREYLDVVKLVTDAFNDLMILTMHFLVFNFSLHIYRRNREITKKSRELNESNEKLQIAYAELQEVTALEERQRIAKEIHDTAGHSITTVIMQTEAAKLLVESDPIEAKRRISAANLQAKHALEELRESVHLLSGMGEMHTLSSDLKSIIHDSTDGTDITIRSEIDEVTLCDSKSRFICNTLKEGISNGLRHGGATAFWFELKVKDGRVEFFLSDNGSGADISKLAEGFGLKGMRARAESLGGSVYFDAEEDEGFEIHLTLPLDNVHKEEKQDD
ncbi:MAG: sensor histidine kinase [Clostridia bacterium]|nr:sensor histidine kinase [Clostridia bacterium]